VITLKLHTPIQLGSELLEELSVKWTARAMKGFSLPLTADGGVLFQPYELARVGVQMAGQPSVLLDKLAGPDIMALAQVVMSFFGDALTTGSAP
jgi:hypothetical protein